MKIKLNTQILTNAGLFAAIIIQLVFFEIEGHEVIGEFAVLPTVALLPMFATINQ